MPTAKSLTTTPPQLATALDHFKCYRVKGARFARAQVEVETQFGSQQVDVKKPRYLCKPVDKNGEGIHGPSTRLMCYKLRAARPQVPDSVFTTNQFESNELEVFGARELCVPATEQP